MSRTADRYLKKEMAQTNLKPSNKYFAAAYIRLSTDSDYTGSDSVQNQRKLAGDFMKKETKIETVVEYIDDGRTGTNFARPAFERMMADVRLGKINCIIAKDLSRFGREYLEAGNYIEKVFPFLGVRFISINDGYDSADPFCNKELLTVSLKNLMHEMYAKDISKKISSTYQMKQENGMFYRTVMIPYGYKMNEENNNYIPDKDTFDIVKEIFRKYENGVSKYRICRELQEQGIMTPKQYVKTGRVYREPSDAIKAWHISTIERILKNPVYVGTVIRHKTEKHFWSGEKNVLVPESEWTRIENNHEAVICSEQFFKVQELLRKSKDVSKDDRLIENHFQHPNPHASRAIRDKNEISPEKCFKKNVFSGKLFCWDCKNNMIRTVGYHMIDGKKYRHKVFKCAAHRNMGNMCDSKFIEEEKLCEILYETVRKQLNLLKSIKKIVESDVKLSFENNLNKIEKEKIRLANSKALLEQEYIACYDSYQSDNNRINEFRKVREKYLVKMQYIQEAKAALEKRNSDIEKCQKALIKLIKEWLSYDNYRQLTEDMVDTFIEKIELYAGKKVEITLRYQDGFALFENYLQEEGKKLGTKSGIIS